MKRSRLQTETCGSVRILLPPGPRIELPSGFTSPHYHPEGEHARHGRGGTLRIELPDGGHAYYRPYRHGGLLGRLRGSMYLDDGVLVQEMEAALRLLADGVRVAPPLAGRVERGLLGVRLGLLTAECPGTTLFDVLGEGDTERALRAARAAGRRIAEMQRAGFRHADLHPGNLIVEPSGDVAVLDLARGRFGGRHADAASRRALVRCARFLFKRGRPPTARQVIAFLQGYTGSDRALRRRLLAELGRELLRALQRRGYRSERLDALLVALPVRA